MKKGQTVTGVVEQLKFPNKGIVKVDDDSYVVVKNTIPGQTISCVINKLRKGKPEGRLTAVDERSPLEIESRCPHFSSCGGCSYQTLPYEEQLKIKKEQVFELISPVIDQQDPSLKGWFEGIKGSPNSIAYRNKMEFSFGDEEKDGPLSLGMHKRGSFYDIVSVTECQLVHDDYHKILSCTLDYFKSLQLPFFHKIRHEGYLRHLLVRRAEKTGEILIDLVTTTQMDFDLTEWKNRILSLLLDGKLVGILHTENDSFADIVQNDRTNILYGQDFFYEEILGLRFKITPFSFFQTNSSGAEVLYETAREFIHADGKDQILFDLYSGTGTIAQMMSPVVKKVIGVEIVEEAVEASKKNATMNGLHNCEFLAGNVLKVLDDIEEKPDLIILDPPRDGIHPKALPKIIAYGVPKIVYISCKPTSLARDLEVFIKEGYVVKRVCAVDMFPGTAHVETVCLLSKK